MTPVRLEPKAPQSPVKHSTTEPLRSLYVCLVCIILYPRLINLIGFKDGIDISFVRVIVTGVRQGSLLKGHVHLTEYAV